MRCHLYPALPAVLGVTISVAIALLAPGCAQEERVTLHVWGADALAASFREMKAKFERLHPECRIALNIHSSVLVTRLIPDHEADVAALADYRLVEKVLNPDTADWVVKFASDEIVLAGHNSSKRRAEITSDNWYEVLLKPDTRFGIANPTQDPCGYWSRLTWILAEKHYFASRGNPRPLVQQLVDKCPEKFIALDANRLIADLLVPARVDYAFVYKTHAVDHKLGFTPLPKEINLGDPTHADDYAQAEITVPDYHGGSETIQGTYIAFGITVTRKSRHPELAREFVRCVLSPIGQEVLQRSGFNTLSPARVPKWCKRPEFLADIAVPEK